MPRKSKIGIQPLLLRIFLPVVMVAALILATLVYNRIHATILRQFDDRLAVTSALTGAMIDPADHDWLIAKAVEDDAASAEQDLRYRRNVEPMQRIRQRLELTYIYTQVASGAGEVRYILDGTEGEEHTPLGSPDTLPPDTIAGLREVEERNGIYVSPIEYQEKWGLLKTAAAPVYDARGHIRGTAGADVNVSVIRVATQNALFLSAMIGLASLLACLLVTMYIVRRVARPIERLTQEALRIASGDHHPPAEIDSPREVRSLRNSLAQLNDHITGELEAAVAGAASHRLSESERWLLASEGGGAAVVIVDGSQQQILWLRKGAGGFEDALASRAMRRLRDRIDRNPHLTAQIIRLADLDRGVLLFLDLASRRLSMSGSAAIELEIDGQPLQVAPDETVALPPDAALLRHGAIAVMVRNGAGR